MRALGLDVGTKTVGMAVSDELGYTAQGVTTLRRTQWKADLEYLQKFIQENNVSRLVVGLPLNMNGTEGPRSEDARKLGQALHQMTGLPVTYWDERLTTVAAERVLLEADVSRKKRKAVIDQLAATLILQGWLDAQPQSHDESE